VTESIDRTGVRGAERCPVVGLKGGCRPLDDGSNRSPRPHLTPPVAAIFDAAVRGSKLGTAKLKGLGDCLWDWALRP